MTTLFTVRFDFPEDRDEEFVSAPFTKKAKAEEYAASEIHDRLSQMEKADAPAARDIRLALHNKDYADAVELWNDYWNDAPNECSFTIVSIVVNRDILKKPLVVSAPCPTQEEIDEGVTLHQEGDYFVARYERKEIARSTTTKQLFRLLRKAGLVECFPRIFEVNDHGNVTEYAYSGKKRGSWV